MNSPANVLAAGRRHLDAFWRWWIAELTSAFQERVIPFLPIRRRRGVLEISLTDIELRCYERRRADQVYQAKRPTAQSDMSQVVSSLLEQAGGIFSSIELRLPEDWILTRRLQLPLGLKSNLRPAIELQLGRLTPFLGEDIHFDSRVVAERPAQLRMDVLLAISPRRVVDPLLQLLLQRANRSRVTSSLVEHPRIQFEFLRVQANSGSSGSHRIERGLIYGAAILCFLSISVSIYQQVHRQRVLDQKIASLKSKAEATENTRTSLDQRLDQVRFIAAELNRPSEAEMIAALTKALPADSWVFQLQQQRDHLEISGQSTDAAVVDSALAKLSRFSNVALRSVAQDPGTGGDHFDISITLKEDAAP